MMKWIIMDLNWYKHDKLKQRSFCTFFHNDWLIDCKRGVEGSSPLNFS